VPADGFVGDEVTVRCCEAIAGARGSVFGSEKLEALEREDSLRDGRVTP
jgi:hypothetical protein